MYPVLSSLSVMRGFVACTSFVGDSAYDALSDALVLGMCSFLKLVY